MTTPTETPSTADLANALALATGLLQQKAIYEAQIATIQAAIAQLDAEIVASAANIGPISEALNAYATTISQQVAS